MSIEAMKRVIEAFDSLSPDHPARHTVLHINALRTAIQQAEAQQPVTGETVACANPDGLKSNWHAHHAIVNKAALQMVRNALRNDVERGLKVRGEMLAELDSATFQAHPAQDVRDDVVRVPVQVLKDASEALGNFVSDHGWGDADMQAMDNLDAYIARHDAKAQKGQP